MAVRSWVLQGRGGAEQLSGMEAAAPRPALCLLCPPLVCRPHQPPVAGTPFLLLLLLCFPLPLVSATMLLVLLCSACVIIFWVLALDCPTPPCTALGGHFACAACQLHPLCQSRQCCSAFSCLLLVSTGLQAEQQSPVLTLS
eukprot:1156973-Pelagomonas_calceolata.AAC.2